MTEVLVEQQLQLTSIVEIVQSKLTKNFTILLKKLNKNDQQLKLHIEQTNKNMQSANNQIIKLEKTLQEQQISHLKTIQDMMNQYNRLEQKVANNVEENKDVPLQFKRIHDQLFNTQLQFEEKMKNKERQLEQICKNIQILALEQNRLNDQINKKENKVEAQKIVKETTILKDKNHHLQSQIKLATHKIEKMEILSQKAERMQAKKDIQLMRQIQERVKKQLKTVSTSKILPQINQTNSYILQQNQQSTGAGTAMQSSTSTPKPTIPKTESETMNNLRRIPSIISEEQLLNTTNLSTDSMGRGEVEHIIQKWSDKIKQFQVQFKQINQNLKVLNRNATNKRPDQNNKENNSEMIKDKINEMKPEMVKMWAKIDTIEDRLTFSQRKTEDKLKGVNELASLVKQNSITKLDERLKNLQTQIFTSLKQTKSKLQSKVSQNEYDKYKQLLQDRIAQINDLISLKTDKLEVKKALFFLETKIKQIILVITQDQENQKDALLTKKQVKCISCDKEMEKFTGLVSTLKGNWDNMPSKDHRPELLGRCGMNYYGTLNKKAKNKLEGKQLPSLHKKGVSQSPQSP